MRRFATNYILLSLISLVCVGCAASRSQDPATIPNAVQDRILEEQVNAVVLQQQAATTPSSGQPVPTFKPAASKAHLIRPGVKIAFEVVEDEGLKGTYQVGFDGELQLPYNVKIQANGLSIKQLQKKLASSYAPFFRFKPSIRVSVADKRQMIEVQGLVAKPGKIFVNRADSLDHIIAQSGGLGSPGDLKGATAPKYVRVIPAKGASYAVGLRDYYAGVSPVSFQWTGGDKIFFQSERPSDLVNSGTVERASVQLLGQIQTPGAYPYENGKSFFHYLVSAGGPTEKTDFEHIEIVRLQEGQRATKVYDISKKEVLPDISPGDIVIVHAQQNDSSVTDASNILSSIATALLAAVAL